jgi:hypothetical protein
VYLFLNATTLNSPLATFKAVSAFEDLDIGLRLAFREHFRDGGFGTLDQFLRARESLRTVQQKPKQSKKQKQEIKADRVRGSGNKKSCTVH